MRMLRDSALKAPLEPLTLNCYLFRETDGPGDVNIVNQRHQKTQADVVLDAP